MTSMTSTAQETESTAPPSPSAEPVLEVSKPRGLSTAPEDWADIWETIHDLRILASSGFPLQPGSELAIIDGAIAPICASTTMDYLLLTAIDHLHCLKTLVTELRALHMFAPFTLVRSVIETASVVLWAMNGDTRERISKVLRFEYQGTKLAKDVYVTLDKEAAFSSRSTNSPEANELIRRQRDLIETLADGYGVRPELATYPTSTKMIEGAYESLNGTPMIYGWWQIASGAAHGKSWPASFLLADGDPSRPDDWKQGNFGNLMTMVQCAVGLTVSATDFRMRLGGVDARISDLV